MDIEKELKTLIKNSIEFDLKEEDIVIERPKKNDHGDYSSNVDLKFCKVLGKNPMDVAEDIKNNISSNLVEKIEIVRPGFINFFVKKDYLLDNIINIIEQGSSYGKLESKNKSVNVEFASINPTGIIHLGHARGSCFGDSLANVLAFAGYDVTREYYVNDAGNQMNNMALSIIERYKEIQGLESHMEDDYYHGKEIIDIAQKLYNEYGNKLDINDVKFFRDYGLKTFLNRIKEDLEAINVKFDVWTSEQTLRDRGLVSDALKKLKEQGYTYEKDGHIEVKGEALKPYGAMDNLIASQAWTFKESPIISFGIVNYLQFGKSPEETIEEYKKNLIMFQFPCKKLSFDYLELEEIDKDTGNIKTTRLQNMNRVFPAKKELERGIVYKHKERDGKHTKSKIAGLPENMFVYNGDIRGEETVKELDKRIDFDYYVNRIYERILEFVNIPKVKDFDI